MKQILQRALDSAEDFATRRRWVRLVFTIVSVKQRLGLEVWRK